MRIGIYDPYLDTLGGGERYVLSAASCLSEHHQVDIFWSDASLLNRASQKLNVDLSKVAVVPDIFSKKSLFSQKILQTGKYDRIIFLSDGSIPLLFSKKNILLFQFPVNWVKGKSLTNKVKLKRIHKIICYTDFVKRHLDRTFHLKANVVYPPVEILGYSEKKENIVLSVGRFTKSMNEKKQEMLIDAFKKMHKNDLKDWKLILIGSYLPNDEEFVDHIKRAAAGFPITIITNATYSELTSYYKKAKIYWHAAGYGEDLEKHPERAEHFGITTVEAMGAGVVPVVFNAGGQREIVTQGETGYLWNDLAELENFTKKLIEENSTWNDLSKKATLRAVDFNTETFCSEITRLVEP